ncbi:MAG: hypothetical protein AB1489_40680 [Acidobacteriota bacterium]
MGNLAGKISDPIDLFNTVYNTAEQTVSSDTLHFACALLQYR